MLYQIIKPLKVGFRYQGHGDYPSAEFLLAWALSIIEQGCGQHDYRVAVAATNLAVLFQSMSPPACTTPHPKLQAAEKLLQRSLHITRQAYGSDHPEVAQRLNNLAMLLRSQGKLADATPLMEQAVKITESAVAAGTEGAAKFGVRLDNLGRLYLDQGKLANAEDYLQQAMTALEPCLPDTAQDLCFCLHNIAKLYRSQDNYEQAEACLQHAAEVQEAHR